jgi:hypothetical protein
MSLDSVDPVLKTRATGAGSKNSSEIDRTTRAESFGSPSGVGPAIAVALAVWLVLVLFLGAKGAFVGSRDELPLLFLLFQTLPVLVFLALYAGSGSFRAWVLGADLRLLTAIQGWRWMGFAFLAVYAQGLLPGVWAWPASLGDVAVGITAPWVCLALVRRPGFAANPLFVAWNLFGILDLVVAIGTGGAVALGLVEARVTMAPVAQLPLALIPAYLVPIFVMLHLAAIFQARRLATSGRVRRAGASPSH